jgi:hypothetical protein
MFYCNGLEVCVKKGMDLKSKDGNGSSGRDNTKDASLQVVTSVARLGSIRSRSGGAGAVGGARGGTLGGSRQMIKINRGSVDSTEARSNTGDSEVGGVASALAGLEHKSV